MDLFLADDCLLFDNLVLATLTYRDSGAEVSIQNYADGTGMAVRRAVTHREAAASGGRYLSSDVRFSIPTVLATTQPRPGDVVTCDGVRYTILEVAKATLGSRWACLTRSLAVTHRLDDRITIQRMTESVGLHGEPKLSYADWLVNLAASVQPIQSDTGENHEQRFTSTRYSVRLEQQLPELDVSQYRVVHKGKRHQVLSIRNPEQIDQLTELTIVDDPWPI